MLATGKDAQTAADIVEEIDAEDVATANNLEEGNNYHRCEGDAYWMRWMSRLHNCNHRSQTKMVPHFQGRKKKISDGSEQISTSITNAAMLFRGNI
ncbi:hypothetical protein Goarm_003269 [Gossypium armourianum]|uniref:Uncharacterized protein n=1 Tax=Gossypium armourianum TaxID=34283 RepID=A0A7J9K2L8_9ROSI|nr:hypothetical protein [Gossypium armourianum]